eukprot:1067922-Pelagomonas_calceolata.AAC.8
MLLPPLMHPLIMWMRWVGLEGQGWQALSVGPVNPMPYHRIAAPEQLGVVKAEVDAAGKPLQTIVQEKVPEAQQFVRVNMNGNSERSSIAFRDSLEVRDTARTTEANSETKPL